MWVMWRWQKKIGWCWKCSRGWFSKSISVRLTVSSSVRTWTWWYVSEAGWHKKIGSGWKGEWWPLKVGAREQVGALTSWIYRTNSVAPDGFSRTPESLLFSAHNFIAVSLFCLRSISRDLACKLMPDFNPSLYVWLHLSDWDQIPAQSGLDWFQCFTYPADLLMWLIALTSHAQEKWQNTKNVWLTSLYLNWRKTHSEVRIKKTPLAYNVHTIQRKEVSKYQYHVRDVLFYFRWLCINDIQ